MKKWNLIFAIIFPLYFAANAQDYFDHLMIKSQLDCEDVALNSSFLFQKYFNRHQSDSAEMILTYWNDKCGSREPIERIKILLHLDKYNFIDSLPSDYITLIFNYQNRRNLIKNKDITTYEYYKPYFGYIPPGEDFDQFTHHLADSLKANFDENSMEYLLCEFYSNNSDTILKKIQDDNYKKTILYRQYFAVVDQYLNKTDVNIAFLVGCWIPTGGISTLGNHFQWGIMLGAKKKRMSYDATISLNMGHSKNYYYAWRNDSLERTNHYLGGYIGFDVGYDAFQVRRHFFRALAGVGIDGFDVFKEDKDNDLKAVSIISYNFNFGLGYRYFFANNGYMELRIKYNVVDYTLGNVVDMKGNPVSIQLAIGGLGNNVKDSNLKALEYDKFSKKKH